MTAPDSIARRRSVGGAFRASVAVTAGIAGLNLVTGVLIARTLGPHGRGELTAVLLWPTLLGVLGSLGLSDALTYYSARDQASVASLVGSGVALALLQAGVLIAIGLVLEPFVLHQYGPPAVHLADVLVIGYVPATLLALALLGVLNGRQHLIAFQSLRGIVIFVTALTLATLAAVDSLSVRTAVYGYVGANLFTMLLIAVVLWRLEHPRIHVYGPILQKLLGFGLKSQTSTASFILNGTLDQLLVSVALAPQLLGLYTVAATVASVVTMVGYTAAPVVFPVLAATVDDATRRERAAAATRTTMLVSLAVAVPLILLAPELIGLVFGRAFGGAATPARILVSGSAIFSVNRALEAALKASGRPLDAGIAETTALVVTAGSLAVLLPLFGLIGAALASGVGALASCFFLVSRSGSALGLSAAALLVPHPSDAKRLAEMVRTVSSRRAVGGDAIQ